MNKDEFLEIYIRDGKVIAVHYLNFKDEGRAILTDDQYTAIYLESKEELPY